MRCERDAPVHRMTARMRIAKNARSATGWHAYHPRHKQCLNDVCTNGPIGGSGRTANRTNARPPNAHVVRRVRSPNGPFPFTRPRTQKPHKYLINRKPRACTACRVRSPNGPKRRLIDRASETANARLPNYHLKWINFRNRVGMTFARPRGCASLNRIGGFGGMRLRCG